MAGSDTLSDRRWMRRALALARQAWGRTTPNPMVGAVVVKEGVAVGEGYHHQAGTPHAEVHALRAAGAKAEGATLYVTLEPCCTAGRTPPCTDAILQAGIRRVVAATPDPNPRHAGRGIELLRQAGVEVKVGCCQKEAKELNKAFFHHITTGRPYVLLKMAMTLDGKIAAKSGDSQWITGSAARCRVQELRRWCDAILVGGETLRLDHPALTVREPADWPCQPKKIVFTHQTLAEVKRYFPEDADVSVIAPQTQTDWNNVLQELGRQNVMALLLEGGGELAGIALRAGIIDEVEFHVAPKLLTGRGSRPVTGGNDPLALAEARNLDRLTVKRAGNDLIITGRLRHE